MPEYLAPGVYVEEVSFRSKSIEGVSTTTTGFIGPARYGPVDLEPELLTSLGEFERIYGDGQPLYWEANKPTDNYLWHAVRAFFEEGGKRLYVMRVYQEKEGDDSKGRASIAFPSSGNMDNQIRVVARFPGRLGAMRVRLTLKLGQNIIGSVLDENKVETPTIGAVANHDVVWISDISSPISSPPGDGELYHAQFDQLNNRWEFNSLDSPPVQWTFDPENPTLSSLQPDFQVRVVTLSVSATPVGSEQTLVWNDLPLDPRHKRGEQGDSLFDLFAQHPENASLARSLPIVFERGSQLDDAVSVVQLLFPQSATLQALNNLESSDDERSQEFVLTNGNDGIRPNAGAYEGKADDTTLFKTGLKAFEDLEDISIVAAPGSSFDWDDEQYNPHARTIMNLLISHAERMRYRIAVLDCGDEQSISKIRKVRAKIDSKHAALYYPWIRIMDPITRREMIVPPSGAVAGIYARNDIERGVYKAPANEVVRSAIGFEYTLNKSQQDVLNPEGINCFRFFEGRGFRLWGARTISSDPEWKYVNLRRYFAYLERSIDKGTQWAVFEPNGDALWANVRRTIEDFLLNEWQMGALLGDKPEKAFFVRCDRSTMTQNDLDNGRLVCLIGVAPLRPAEFVIFRIGQWTGDSKR